MRVLVGRDLSAGGMYVEPHPDLKRGDRLTLALHTGREQRLLVEAEVVRKETEGLALRFRDGNPVLADQIEAVIEAAMRRTDAEGHGDVACVITEIAAIRTRAGVGCPEAQRFEGRVRP